MKNQIISILVLFFLMSCSDDNTSNENITSLSVSSILTKNYNSATNAIIMSSNYIIIDNRIQSIIGTNSLNSQQHISTFNYLNNRISLIENSINNILSQKNHYIYNSANKLIEYRTESYNNQGQIQSINKYVFNRIQDTIYSEWTRKISTASLFSLISNCKIVLDQNQNRIYLKQFLIVRFQS